MLQTSTILRHWFRTRWPQLYALWKFSRPHTVIGTTLSVLALWSLAGVYSQGWQLIAWSLQTNAQWPWQLWQPLLLALLACLCGNVYIVGLNQLCDQPIDRINKPHLPLASGEFSRQQGRRIVLMTGLLALIFAAWGGIWLMGTVSSSLLIGTAYSLPPIRLKRFPLWASLCILTVRGGIVNLGLFHHFASQFGGGQRTPIAVWSLTGFILLFSIAIAIFKDIPDAEGDRRHRIQTFTLRFGPQVVFWLTSVIITLCYGGLCLAAMWWLTAPALWIFQGCHGAILIFFWASSLQFAQREFKRTHVEGIHGPAIDAAAVSRPNSMAIATFYQFIWKLFFLEYICFPLLALAG
ncbi:MAG: homogentisate phytyltransferase [Cyanobacteria bacterium P01_H01_bin.121]